MIVPDCPKFRFIELFKLGGGDLFVEPFKKEQLIVEVEKIIAKMER